MTRDLTLTLLSSLKVHVCRDCTGLDKVFWIFMAYTIPVP